MPHEPTARGRMVVSFSPRPVRRAPRHEAGAALRTLGQSLRQCAAGPTAGQRGGDFVFLACSPLLPPQKLWSGPRRHSSHRGLLAIRRCPPPRDPSAAPHPRDKRSAAASKTQCSPSPRFEAPPVRVLSASRLRAGRSRWGQGVSARGPIIGLLGDGSVAAFSRVRGSSVIDATQPTLKA